MKDFGSSAAYETLRSYLNSAIQGNNTTILLESLSNAIAYLSYNAEAVKQQCYVATASGTYLDEIMGGWDITRPAEVGISDTDFRNIGFEIINRKQIRDLINHLLFILFGAEAAQASYISLYPETYALQDGDQLIISFDGEAPVLITFTSSEFASIGAATAEEVAAAITNQIRAQSRTGRAYSQDNGIGPQVYLISDTIGPQSSVQVLGGRAQNLLGFPAIRPTTADAQTAFASAVFSGVTFTADFTGQLGNSITLLFSGLNTVATVVTAWNVANPSNTVSYTGLGSYVPPAGLVTLQGGHSPTEWEVTRQPSGNFRYTWIGGDDPSLGVVQLGDYVNIYGVNFLSSPTVTNQGTFNITKIQGGVVNNAYFEVANPQGVNQILVVQATDTDVLFYDPVVFFVNQQLKYAAAFQLVNGNLQIFIPASTIVVRRSLKGAGYMNDAGSGVIGQYLYDPTQLFYISNVESNIDPQYYIHGFFNAASGNLLKLKDASQFPDAPGYIILGYGTSVQEGPIPYLARPDSKTLLLSPAYVIQNDHPVGVEITTISRTSSTVTANTAIPHGLATGDTIDVEAVPPGILHGTDFNGTFTVNVINPTQLTWSQSLVDDHTDGGIFSTQIVFTDVAYVPQKATVPIDNIASQYPFYITGTSAGRIFSQELISSIAAAGITITWIILYPSDIGLGEWGRPDSEKVFIWGSGD